MRKLSFIILLSITPLMGCPLFGGAQKSKAKAANSVDAYSEPDGDDEKGLNDIVALLREFSRAVDKKDFDTASRLLTQIESGTNKASEVTKSHPDFEEVAERVARARPRYDRAVEDDRIARRNAAIDNLIRRGNQLTERARIVLAELQQRVPEAQDTENIKEVLSGLSELDREGQGFLDEPRYLEHAKVRDAMTQSVAARKRSSEWQITAKTSLNKPIEVAVNALAQAKRATQAAEQLAPLQAAVEGLSACVNVAADLEGTPGFEPGLVVETRFGTLPLAEVKKKCLDSGSKVRTQAAALSYSDRFYAVVKKVDAVMAAVKRAQTAAELLTASEAAVEGLGDCSAILDAVETWGGYDPKTSFDTALGKHNGPKLGNACSDERKRLSQKQPTWRWQKSFEAVLPALNDVKKSIDTVATTKNPNERAAGWMRVQESLTDCVVKARTLAKERDADKSHELVTPFGELNVAGVETECQKQRDFAKTRLEEAQKQQKAEGFIATCKADEVEVARREGIPNQVMTVDGGRIFVYESKSYGFDTAGRRFDFGAKWKEGVEGVAGEVTRALGAVRDAQDGATMLKGITAAQPVLDVCKEALSQTEKHAGFDGAWTVDSALGKLSAVQLRKACEEEKTKLSAQVQGLKWRVRLEEVVTRATQAQDQVDNAKNEASGDKQVQMLGGALGSFKECIERADALPKEPGATPKLAVKSAFGNVTAAALSKACKGKIPLAEKSLEAAYVLQKLDTFLANCKGDEVEVARREGMPTRVESLKNGRVFVYELTKKKSDAKRFAFDPAGKRVEEKILKR